jgi:autotransporter-associated beta strand protein
MRHTILLALALALAAAADMHVALASTFTFSPAAGTTKTYTTDYVTAGITNFTMNGAGTVVMQPNGPGNFLNPVVNGTTTLNSGTMQLNRTAGAGNGNRTLPNTLLTINPGATLQVTAPNQIGDATVVQVNGGTYTVNIGEYTNSLVMSNNALVNGTASFVLNGGVYNGSNANVGLYAVGGGNAGTMAGNLAMATNWTDGTTNGGAARQGNGTTPINVAAGTTLTVSGILLNGHESQPIGSMSKQGAGRLTLSGTGSYYGTTTVAAGSFTLNGLLTSSQTGTAGTLTVQAGASLNGSGRTTGAIAGAGTVNPGNSPGLLTAAQVDPSGGLDFVLEFSGTAPTYGNATNSVNDVLRLTGSTPFISALTSANTKTLFLNLTEAQLVPGTILEGGFFTDVATDFASLLNNATWDNAGFQVYVLGDGDGTDNALNGQGYYNWRNPAMFGWTQSLFMSTTARTANFGSGNVNGQVMLLTVAVPEPSTLALLGMAGLGAAWRTFARRRFVPACAGFITFLDTDL